MAWGELEDKVRFDDETPGVLGAVWKNASGADWCIVLANVSDKDQHVRFTLPVSADFQQVNVPGEKLLTLEIDGAVAEVELPPYSFSAWRTDLTRKQRSVRILPENTGL